MPTQFDAERWRKDTPAAYAGRIHLNNAGAALSPRPVIEAVHDHLALEVQLGGYEAAEAASADIAATYQAVARLLGTAPANVAIVENATVAFAQALSAFDFAPGDVIVTTRNDYISNQLMYLSLAARRGLEVARAADLPEGGVDPASVRELVRNRRPRLVALTWVPTNSGLVQPAEDVGEICLEEGVPYLVDACQAVGQITTDVQRLHCDFLAATARKFLRGPRGVGFLFVSDRMLAEQRHPLFLDMRGGTWIEADRFTLVPDARRFENWEFNYGSVLGLGAAARYALDVGIAEAGAYAAAQAQRIRDTLAGLPGVRVLDRGERLCAIVTAEFAGRDCADIVAELRREAISINTTTRESALIDMDAKEVGAAIRISPHYYNTPRDIGIACGALAALVEA